MTIISRQSTSKQQQIDLRSVAAMLLGDGIPGGAVVSYPSFDPDSEEIHIYRDHYRDPRTGESGDTVRFVRRVLNCRRADALALLAIAQIVRAS